MDAELQKCFGSRNAKSCSAAGKHFSSSMSLSITGKYKLIFIFSSGNITAAFAIFTSSLLDMLLSCPGGISESTFRH